MEQNVTSLEIKETEPHPSEIDNRNVISDLKDIYLRNNLDAVETCELFPAQK